jgi:phosphoribosylaminoimidazole carboxylase (NCAIR synthetase)
VCRFLAPQDKYIQKLHLQKHNIPLPEFMDVPTLDAAYAAGKE